MLVIGRKQGETIVLDGEITITLVRTGHGRTRIGIDAPAHVKVVRGELLRQKPKGGDAKIA